MASGDDFQHRAGPSGRRPGAMNRTTGMSDNDTELSPEEWDAIESWWRGSQHPKPYYVQPQIKGRPPRNSYTLPDSAVDALGNGDPQTAGMVLAHLFGLGPFTGEGDPRVIDPDVVADIGHGSLVKGHRVLTRFVQMLRRQGAPQHIEQPDGHSPDRIIE
jgi:hypothetical protein